MKKITKIVLSLVLALLITISICSCKITNDSLLKSGYFTYNYDKNGDIVLGGLTEEGEQQETLVFPSQINGKKVVGIGVYKYIFAIGDVPYQFFESKKLKYIYFPKGYSHTSLYNNFYDNLKNVEIVYWGDYQQCQLLPSIRDAYVSIQFVNQQDSSTTYKDGFLNEFPNIHIGNVEYYMNDGTDDIYMVDHVSGTKVHVEPSIPYREGYTFRGWYKDIELTQLFDFENDIIPEIKLDEEGIEIIDVTKIYAGWDLKDEK